MFQVCEKMEQKGEVRMPSLVIHIVNNVVLLASVAQRVDNAIP